MGQAVRERLYSCRLFGEGCTVAGCTVVGCTGITEQLHAVWGRLYRAGCTVVGSTVVGCTVVGCTVVGCTVGRGCLAQIRARVLHRVFLKSIWSKDFKTIFVLSLG